MKTPLSVVRLGHIGYRNANVLQTNCREKLIRDGHKTPTLFLLEHHPVYTIGLRSKEYTPELESRLRSGQKKLINVN